ncbi:UvrD-helicase domain-containing protein [Fulvivirga sedimenti]|uniref:DNA 3'-5' helicase n=1 Tax=Fulvivirga sedimenti TaxID=2879465 RepID=A0A9X1KY49_9BACT|nr:UvrD-helicase domain-containing protein [Fulvivirga sedimenti]MCA6075293.1 UvrD-helicase domain-containing protein [Fulvivirga sedimenti]MCA6076470.1 UvrD-helicase domain-containing protein [Fulvivirga sedimenti]MCA6077598.1 UvrD-helicase domain-containing protein [Fulvivirga sedimenti]
MITQDFLETESLTIYRSSAGSGKTYTLTREYILLALSARDRYAYRKILAVTFTNKAMKEMKDRIIAKLDQFSRGDLEDTMAKELQRQLDWSPKEFQERCAALLSEVLHHYSHFAITTIDAFFQQIIRSFARELHIAGGYRLELEQDLVYREVIRDLMEEVDSNKHIRSWLAEFSFSKLEYAKAWEVERELLAFLKELDQESFRSIENEIKTYEDSRFEQLREIAAGKVRGFEDKLQQLGQRAVSTIHACGLEQHDFMRASAANFLFNLSARNYDEKKLTKTFRTCASGEGSWFSKANTKILAGEIATLDASAFQEIAYQVLTFWDDHIFEYKTAKAVYKNIYLFALARDLLRKLDTNKKEHDILFISDATRLIRKLVKETDAPFIYEKVGSFFENYLIDEFQDTSRFQWDSFRPLIENSLSEGKTNLIVGDVKQSIYRWRGGDLELLQTEVENTFQRFGPRVLNLATNYRSRKNIVDFNNAVFSEIPAVLKKSFEKLTEDPVYDIELRLRDIFSDVKQNFAGKASDPEGYVEGRFLDNDTYDEMVFPQIVEVLKNLQDRKVPLKETAILVRRNKDGKKIAEYLMQYHEEGYSFDVVSNETLHLSASTAVSCLIAALRYINNAEDDLTRAALLHFYRQLNSSGSERHVFQQDEMEQKLLLHIAALKRLPLFSMVENLISILGLQDSRGHFPYLQTFQDHVLSYMKREKGDVQGFIDFWDDKLHKESIRIADDLDAIRIMTIHKAKGLEFHSVLLPFLNWDLNNDKGVNWFIYETDPTGPTRVPVNFSSGLKDTAFAGEFREESYKNYLDSLNMLYVAFTRSAHDLWFMAKRGDWDSRISKVVEELLLNPSFPLPIQREEDIISYGNPDFVYAGAPGTPFPEIEIDHYSFFDWQKKTRLKPVPERIRNEQQQISISIGILVHDILSRVKYLDDVSGVLTETRFAEGLTDQQFEGLRSRLKEAFRTPEVRQWFDNSWEVRNEQAIFSNGQEFRPDRVIHRQGHTMVIDYKTGIPKSADMEQMKTYLSLVKELYTGKVEGRILYLEDLNIIQVQ